MRLVNPPCRAGYLWICVSSDCIAQYSSTSGNSNYCLFSYVFFIWIRQCEVRKSGQGTGLPTLFKEGGIAWKGIAYGRCCGWLAKRPTAPGNAHIRDNISPTGKCFTIIVYICNTGKPGSADVGQIGVYCTDDTFFCPLQISVFVILFIILLILIMFIILTWWACGEELFPIEEGHEGKRFLRPIWFVSKSLFDLSHWRKVSFWTMFIVHMFPPQIFTGFSESSLIGGPTLRLELSESAGAGSLKPGGQKSKKQHKKPKGRHR